MGPQDPHAGPLPRPFWSSGQDDPPNQATPGRDDPNPVEYLPAGELGFRYVSEFPGGPGPEREPGAGIRPRLVSLSSGAVARSGFWYGHTAHAFEHVRRQAALASPTRCRWVSAW